MEDQSEGLLRYDNIIKSPNDERVYRGLILPNKLRVLLISYPKTDKSAASLDVDVGYLSDPEELPGLAHLCEHMLFLGTEKYPEDNNYYQYLSRNGGDSNAATHPDHTNYYFDVNPDKLQGALDRFSQFFIAPLFNEASTEREINAVHAEHEKNIASDGWRFNQLDKFSADPNHPYSKFGTGSLETLDVIPKQKDINVREELLKFHCTWYSSNIMSLSVFGKESLDELEMMVLEMFSAVENKDVEAPRWDEHPFTDEHFQRKWFIVPIQDRVLIITFPIPDLKEYFRARPVHYWSHLIGHEGKGSLLSALKENGWCNTLLAGNRSAARGFDFFCVIVELTEEGIGHIDDIISLTFQYINMVRENGPLEWIFKECSDIAGINFRYGEQLPPASYAKATAMCLQTYPIEEVLCFPELITEWRPDLIKELGSYLTPEKARIQVAAQIYEAEADTVEPWYGIKFKKEKIPEELIDKWNSVGLNELFQLPGKNDFIPAQFNIKPDDHVDKFPVIADATSFVRVWFKQDREFLVPKALMTFDFVSPLAYADPSSANMTHMFVELFEDSLTEYAYNAQLAGLSWRLSDDEYGLSLTISGYDDKLDVLLEKILDRMFNLTVDEKRFEILKERYIRGLKNFGAQQPHYQASYYLNALLSEHVWVTDELLNACSFLTACRIRQFIPQLLSNMYVEFLVYGNVTKAEALKTARLVESKMTSYIQDLCPLLPQQLLLHRELQLPDGCHFLYQESNSYHKNSSVKLYYQTGQQSTESNMLLEFLAQIIEEPFFNVLRTKEQLGYIVSSCVRQSSGTQGLSVTVQSDKHPQFVEDRIDAFMESMQGYIDALSDEEFNDHKESLATKLLEKPKLISSQSEIYWEEITSQQYNFDHTNIEVAYLRTITQDKLLEFYKEVLHPKSAKKHKLSVHVISTAEGGAGAQKSDDDRSSVAENEGFQEGPLLITDILQFKTRHALFPLAQPFTNVPRKGTQ